MAASRTFPEQAQTLGALLRAPYRKLAQRIYSELAEQGFPEIRPAHSAVFRHIAPQGSRLTELAEQAELTKQSMAYLVGYLEEHGYVNVRADPVDGRARQVRLSARGRRFVEALLAASTRLEDEVARVIGRRELDTLRDRLAVLDSAIRMPGD